MKLLSSLAISAHPVTATQAVNRPSFHTHGTQSGRATGTLKPGEYWWNPKLPPSGPVVVRKGVSPAIFQK